MEQVCLIVDDKDQQHTFKAQIQDILKKEGHNVEIIFINTTSPELLNEEQNIDKDKLKACIKSKIEGKHIDVVASDFDLSDDVVNGLDVIEIIRSIREKVPIILYSGNLENFGNVQNEQFSRRHLYVPFGEFVHLYISKIFKNMHKS